MLTLSVCSTSADPSRAVADAVGRLAALGARPDLVVAQHTADLDAQAVASALASALPGVPIHGGTSCRGVMTERGFQTGPVLGLLAICDPEGAYGTASADLGAMPGRTASETAIAAIARAGRPGERPDLLWITGAPGSEEQVIAGLAGTLGAGIPVAGGSSADEDVSGRWWQFSEQGVHRAGLAVSALFPSRGVSSSFHSGYDPTTHRAVVTAASGRTIQSLGGEPAAAVYDRWTGGILGSGAGSVLARTTLHPLGRRVGDIGGIAYYQLSHPEAVTDGGGLRLFTDVAAGDEVVLMRGSHDSLVRRAGRVARAAIGGTVTPPAGALVIYCAGCMLAVHERMDEVAAAVRDALGCPFLGAFTFGEQGCFPGGANRHGNLMISVLVLPS